MFCVQWLIDFHLKIEALWNQNTNLFIELGKPASYLIVHQIDLQDEFYYPPHLW